MDIAQDDVSQRVAPLEVNVVDDEAVVKVADVGNIWFGVLAVRVRLICRVFSIGLIKLVVRVLLALRCSLPFTSCKTVKQTFVH